MLNIYIFKVLIALHRNSNKIGAVSIIIHVYEEQETGIVICTNTDEEFLATTVKEASSSSLNIGFLPATSSISPEQRKKWKI